MCLSLSAMEGFNQFKSRQVNLKEFTFFDLKCVQMRFQGLSYVAFMESINFLDYNVVVAIEVYLIGICTCMYYLATHASKHAHCDKTCWLAAACEEVGMYVGSHFVCMSSLQNWS